MNRFTTLRPAILFNTLLIMSLCVITGCTSLPSASPLPESYTLYPGTEAEPTLLQTADDLTLFSQWWKPEGEPKAVIILLHGTAAHIGAYTPWAEFLTTQNYALFAFDMRGWGQSQGFGRRAFVRHHDDYVNDLHLAFAEVQRLYPDKPVYLQGESLGASVAMQASTRGGFAMDGLILNAPPVYVNLKVGPGRMPNWLARFSIWTAGIPGRVAPNFPLWPMQHGWAEKWIWNKAIFDDFSRQAIREDEHFTHSPIAAAYVTRLGQSASHVRRHADIIREPFIVLQGSKDYLVSPKSANYLMKHSASPDKTLKYYEGMSHCTLHDTGRGEVWTDIVEWLDSRVPANGQEEEVRAKARLLAEASPEQTFDRLLPDTRQSAADDTQRKVSHIP